MKLTRRQFIPLLGLPFLFGLLKKQKPKEQRILLHRAWFGEGCWSEDSWYSGVIKKSYMQFTPSSIAPEKIFEINLDDGRKFTLQLNTFLLEKEPELVRRYVKFV